MSQSFTRERHDDPGGKSLDGTDRPQGTPTDPTASTTAGAVLPSRLAAEWGLASLMMSAVLFLAAPITLVFNFLFYQAGPEYLSTSDIRLAFPAGILAVLVMWAVCVVSALFGVKGIVAAFGQRQPAGLPLAGVVLSGAALVLWLIVGIDLAAILWTFMR
jgi:hypothetical protein